MVGNLARHQFRGLYSVSLAGIAFFLQGQAAAFVREIGLIHAFWDRRMSLPGGVQDPLIRTAPHWLTIGPEL